MQRPIKFRVWDKKESEWLAASDPNSLTYYGFSLFGEVMLSQRVYPDILQDLVIEQFTGLYDKNGVEIYEGDILRDPILGESEICEVEWIEGDCSFVTRCTDNDHGRQYDSLRKRGDLMEVIGNIHENPELLNDKEG